MIETPARVTYNENLARAFYAQRGIQSTVSPVFKQHQSIILNRHALFPFGYNPSIIRWQGRILMAYRWHPRNTPSTELAIAELDERFNVKTNDRIQFVPAALSTEDPRLFIFRDELYISYVETEWPKRLSGVVKYGLLVEGSPWHVVDIKQPPFGHNDGGAKPEKNWVFFQHGQDLLCLYESHPNQTVLRLENPLSLVSTHPQWPYGTIKGGCIMPWNLNYLRFFHSTLDNEPPPTRRRYYLGACLWDANDCFKTVKISSQPIAIGSEICDLTGAQRNQCSHYKPQVIFPGGVIEMDGQFIVSVGTNDSGCCLLKLKPSDLNL